MYIKLNFLKLDRNRSELEFLAESLNIQFAEQSLRSGAYRTMRLMRLSPPPPEAQNLRLSPPSAELQTVSLFVKLSKVRETV